MKKMAAGCWRTGLVVIALSTSCRGSSDSDAEQPDAPATPLAAALESEGGGTAEEAQPTVDDYINRSLEHYRAGEFRECIATCETALEIDPESALAYNNIGAAYVSLAEYDRAIAACQKALALAPELEIARNNLALAQQPDARATSLPTALEPQGGESSEGAQPTVDDYIRLSLDHYRAGEFRECIAMCEKALEIDPVSALAYNNIGAAHVKLEEYDRAIAACQKALAIDPDLDIAKNNLGWAQLRGAD